MQIDNKTEIGPTNAAVTGAAAAVATATAAGAAKKWVIPKKFGGIGLCQMMFLPMKLLPPQFLLSFRKEVRQDCP